jgi:DNA-binding GntR family transcriptional regulator
VVAAHYALSELEREMSADPLNAALDWDTRNKAFHMAIASNCGSQKLIDLIAIQHDQSRRYRLMAHAHDRSEKSRSRWVRKSADEHSALKEAVLAGDIDSGQDLLRKHIAKATLHVIEEGSITFEGLEKPS